MLLLMFSVPGGTLHSLTLMPSGVIATNTDCNVFPFSPLRVLDIVLPRLERLERFHVVRPVSASHVELLRGNASFGPLTVDIGCRCMLIVGHGMLVGLYRRAWHYHVEMGASMPWYLPGKQIPCWPSLDNSPSACRAGLIVFLRWDALWIA